MTTTRQQRIEQSVAGSLHTAQSTMSQFMTYVLIGQWVLSLLFALFLAPLTWEGATAVYTRMYGWRWVSAHCLPYLR